MTLRIILLFLALLAFCAAAVWPSTTTPPPRVNLLAIGLALWVMSALVPPGM